MPIAPTRSGNGILTNIADYGAAGPHDDWPLGRGFSRWYGFHGALTDQWNPELYRDNRPILFQPRGEYHLSCDLVDHAIADLRDHKTSAPQRPFFLYLAFGACHLPHHVPRRVHRQVSWPLRSSAGTRSGPNVSHGKRTGGGPAGTGLAPLNPGVAPWRDVRPRRPHSVHAPAGNLCGISRTYRCPDWQVGRSAAWLGCLDDTILVLLSDNGASDEGGPTGAINLRKHMVYERRISGSGTVPPRRHRRRAIVHSLSDRMGPGLQYALEVVQEGYPRRRHSRAADRSLAARN